MASEEPFDAPERWNKDGIDLRRIGSTCQVPRATAQDLAKVKLTKLQNNSTNAMDQTNQKLWMYVCMDGWMDVRECVIVGGLLLGSGWGCDDKIFTDYQNGASIC